MDIGWIGNGKGPTTWTSWNGYRKGKGKNYNGKNKGNYKGTGKGFGKNYEGGNGYGYGKKGGYTGKGKGKGTYYTGNRTGRGKGYCIGNGKGKGTFGKVKLAVHTLTGENVRNFYTIVGGDQNIRKSQD